MLRDAIVAQARWGADHTSAIHYAQIRPAPLAAYKAHRLPITTDCSGFATCCYFAAGAPDPNGFNYTGQGNTETLMAHLPHIHRSELQAGDLIVFAGPIEHQHVVVVVDPGGDPLVISHGQEAGPFEIRLSAEAAAHPGQPIVYLQGVPDEPKKRKWKVIVDGKVVAHTRHPKLYVASHSIFKHRHQSVHFVKQPAGK